MLVVLTTYHYCKLITIKERERERERDEKIGFRTQDVMLVVLTTYD